jgi:hypothetical protein
VCIIVKPLGFLGFHREHSKCQMEIIHAQLLLGSNLLVGGNIDVVEKTKEGTHVGENFGQL